MESIIITTGRGSIDLLNPRPEDVDIDDMLRNLSRTIRFNGASPFSVLQHSLWVGRTLRERGHDDATVLAGFVHDLHEYATGDICGPLRERCLIGMAWWTEKGVDSSPWRLDMLCEQVQWAIESHFDLRIESFDSDAINAVDMESRDFELVAMAGKVMCDETFLSINALAKFEVIAAFRAELATLGVTL